jgi:hypothetical protein
LTLVTFVIWPSTIWWFTAGRPAAPVPGFSLYKLVCVSPCRIEWYSSISQQLSQPSSFSLIFKWYTTLAAESNFYFILFYLCVCVCWEWAKETNAQQSGPVLVTNNFNFNIFLSLEFWILIIVIGWNWIYNLILGAETLSGICDTGDKVDDDRNLKGKNFKNFNFPAENIFISFLGVNSIFSWWIAKRNIPPPARKEFLH